MVIHEEALSAIAEAADGGMRDALGILDQASVFLMVKLQLMISIV